jgi:acyl-coenzyme A synthetase/AMP-(fatty) acid ligase
LEAAGKRWYRTGDLVKLDEEGNYVFLGRRDRMVKRRGYRIELGEIEAGIYRHPGIAEAAVIALRSEDSSVNIHAFVRPVEGKKLSVIDLKRFCVGVLPSYMIPDRFFFETGLPKTSTGKIDYQRLAECASERLSEKSA